MNVNHADSEIIDALGGTVEVSRICEVKSPSVSEWRKTGIPRARRQYLQLLRPDIFGSDPNAPAKEGEAADAA